MPERFSLSLLDKIFVSWHAALSNYNGMDYLPALSDDSTLRDSTGMTHALNYAHDNRTHRSDTYIERCNGDRLLCVVLANDEFLYPPTDTLKVLAREGDGDGDGESAPVPRRHRNVFVKLQRDHLKDFAHMIDFAKTYLSATTVKVQLFYSFEADRVVFKAFDGLDPTRGVVITFARLDPVR